MGQIGNGMVQDDGADGRTFPSGGAPRSPEEVADRVREAASRRQPLRIAGAGTWLTARAPVHQQAQRLSLAGLSGIVDYVPGDLTLTALAGTPLDAIDAATRAEGQWLALDPFGAGSGTLGATLATASAGPLAGSIGLPRDLALGMEVVDGGGTRTRAGGRVVKNVAGFDLVRLHIGAWGTLGVITEVTVRLRGQPEADETLALAADHARLAALLHGIRSLPLAPLAAELLNPPLAQALDLGEQALLLVRLAGNAQAVQEGARHLSSLADSAPAHHATWQRLRGVEPNDAVVWRVSDLPTHLPKHWEQLTREYPGGVLLHATTARGVIRVIVPRALAAACVPPAGALVERAPANVWTHRPPVASDRLSSALRRAMDPLAILNPGILG